MNKQKILSILPWITSGIFIFPILWLLIILSTRMSWKLDMNYNEGWNVYYTVKAISGQMLYVGNSDWTSVNYPPLSFYILGIFGKLLDDPLLAGRYISFISLLVIAFIAGYTVIKLGGNIYAGSISGILCLGLFVTYARSYVGMNDPQMLAQATLIIALLIYANSKFQKNQTLLIGTIFIVSAIFIKHNLIALPIAMLFDLGLRSKKQLLKFSFCLTFLGVCFIVMTMVFSGADFLNHINSSRIYDITKAKSAIAELLRNIRWILIAISPWIIYAFRDENVRLIPLYLVFSLIIGTYASGGKGTNINMFFDVFISLSIAWGLMLSYLQMKFINKPLISNLILVILPIIVCSSMLKTLPFVITDEKNNINTYRVNERIFLEDVNFLKTKDDPVICEKILLCYLADKEFIYDPFLVSNKIVNNDINEQDILMKLESGWFKVIQLNNKVPDKYLSNSSYVFPSSLPNLYYRFSENFLRAIGKNYTLTRKTSTGVFYEPKNGALRFR